MVPTVVAGYLRPPQNPDECTFSKTTACLSSDLKRTITPCQYGGDPDCTQCGCLASVGLDALARYRVGGVLPLRHIFAGSLAIGSGFRAMRGEGSGNGARPSAPKPEPAGSV
jgi:hypothetical protein